MDEARYKVVLVGDGSVGKTTLVKKWVSGEFEDRYIPTVKADLVAVQADTSEGKVVFNVWDVAGQEKLRGQLPDPYYVGAQAVLVVFDLSDRTSFTHVGTWLKDVRRVLAEDVPLVMVGNKVDKAVRNHQTRAATYAKQESADYVETSARDDTGLTNALTVLARRLTGKDDLVVTAVHGRPAAQG